MRIVYRTRGRHDKFQVAKHRKDLNCYTYIEWQSIIFFLLAPSYWQSSKSRKHRSSIKRKADLSPLWRAIFCPFSSRLTTKTSSFYEYMNIIEINYTNCVILASILHDVYNVRAFYFIYVLFCNYICVLKDSKYK